MGHSYKDLLVWQKSKALAVEIYGATDGFPKREWYNGLRKGSQRSRGTRLIPALET
jgi:23S rRNA-intervening sequence protein